MVVGLYLLQSNASAAEAAGATHALLELLYLDDLGGEDALDDKLGDTVTLSDLEVGVGVVEEEDLDLAAVVRVDYAGTGVDEVLGGETGARGNAAVGAGRDGDGNVGADEGLAAGRDGGRLRGVEVVAGGVEAAAGRQASLVRELLDLEGRAGLHGGGDGCVVGGGLYSLCGRVRGLSRRGDGFSRGHYGSWAFWELFLARILGRESLPLFEGSSCGQAGDD